MFGPVGRPSATAARRPRRRRVLLVVIAGLVAIIVATLIDQLVHSYQPAERRSVRSWEAAVSPLIAGSNSFGAVLGTFRSSAVHEPRATLDATLQALVLGTRAEAESAGSIGIAPPSTQALELLQTTLNDRAAAARFLVTAVDLATGPNGDIDLATTRLIAMGALLRQADAAYARLQSVLRARGTDVLPASKWLTDPALYGDTAAARFASDLKADPALADQTRLAIVALSIEPAPDRIVGLPTTTSTTPTTSITPTTATALGQTTTTSTLATTGGSLANTTTSSTTTTVAPTPTTLALPPSGSRSYLLPTPTITVSVVVATAGAITLDHVAVSASLTPLAVELSTTPNVVRAAVGTLAPGRSRDVELAPLAVPKNQVCLLRVEVSGAGVSSTVATVTVVTAR